MPTDHELDREIDEVAGWIIRAGGALLSFYDSARAGFIRDTVAVQPDDRQPLLGRTSTSRAFTSLLEVLYFLAEEDTLTHANQDYRLLHERAKQAVQGIARSHFAALSTESDRVRESSQNGINMFTDSHVIMAVTTLHTAGSLAGADGRAALPDPILNDVQTCTKAIWEENLRSLHQWQGGRIHSRDQNHDFVTLHAVRAGDAFGLLQSAAPEWDPELGVRIRNTVLLHLGRHTAGITSQFDPAEVAFSVALLHRFRAPDHQPMTQRALEVIADEQTPDGAWPTSRLVSYGETHLLFPASFEVALTLADLLISELNRGVHTSVELLLQTLSRAFGLVTNTFMSLDKYRGWSNDRVRSPGRLESWATAIVVSFLIRYRQALTQVRQATVLSRYEVSFPAKPTFPWPDLAPILGVASHPNPDALGWISDPTDRGFLKEAVDRYFVKATLASPVQRPENVSLLLPGPPGTRKTSMVERLADALGWPLLTLTPPDFLGPGGLEQFEATAARVFRDLMRLRRVVVLFDECEDFFRRREAEGSPGGRTMGAFITAGMLPRLQRLHKQRWVIFVLATNALLTELDPAVVRPGRFDFQQEMRNPPLRAQRRYVELRIPDQRRRKQLESALVDWAGQSRSQHDQHQGEITFVVLDQLIEWSSHNDTDLDEDGFRSVIAELASILQR